MIRDIPAGTRLRVKKFSSMEELISAAPEDIQFRFVRERRVVEDYYKKMLSFGGRSFVCQRQAQALRNQYVTAVGDELETHGIYNFMVERVKPKKRPNCTDQVIHNGKIK